VATWNRCRIVSGGSPQNTTESTLSTTRLGIEMGVFSFLLVICLLVGLTSSQNYYKTLGVKPTANEKEIKKAYRKLAMKVRSAWN
jgi:DnaJ-domain-containing protein 1